MKKFNKMQKFILFCCATFLGLAIVMGLSVGILTACAEDTTISDTAPEIGAEIEKNETEEEVIVEEETSENSAVLDEETQAKLDEIKGMVQGYIDSRKTEDGKMNFGAILGDAKTWIISAISFIFSTFGGAIVAGVLNRLNKKKDILTEAQIERVAIAAATKTVEKIIGKSIDVDISAEVSKAVKKELALIADGVEVVVDGVKNMELLTAKVALAQSRSRLLSQEEKEHLQVCADKAQSHAGKKLVTTAKIELSKNEEKEVVESKESIEEKNMSFINFDGVGDKK